MKRASYFLEVNMILNGFMGTIYVRTEEDGRIDLWESDVWPTQGNVLDEMLGKRAEIVEILSRNTSEYHGFIDRNDEIVDYDPEKDSENEELFDLFQRMIDEARSEMKDGVFDDSYGEVEILVSSKKTHDIQIVPSLPGHQETQSGLL